MKTTLFDYPAKKQFTLILYAETQEDLDKIQYMRATLDPTKVDQSGRVLEENSTPKNVICIPLDQLLPKKKKRNGR